MPSIFISFSTADGVDIAQHVYRHYKKKGYNVFFSTEEIPYGHKWREEIKKHVEECDIFLLIGTYEALGSKEVDKEINEAKRLGKRIIPCRPDYIKWSDLEKLGIDSSQGPEFKNEYDLVRKLEFQLRREFASTSVHAPRNYTRQQETGLITSSKYEPPSLQTKHSDKEEVDTLFSKAYGLVEIGRYKEAINYYDKALKIDPNYANAWNNKGVALRKLGRHEEAIASYDKALKIDPNDSNAWYNKGIVLQRLGKGKDGEKCFKKARDRLASDVNEPEKWILRERDERLGYKD